MLCTAIILGTVTVPASAQSSIVIDTDQTSTVTLPAGGGTVQVDSGVTVHPATGDGIQGAPGDVWAVTNHGSVETVGNSAIYLQGAGSSVDNYGQISSGNIGIYGNGDITVVNRAGATIQAAAGLVTSGGVTLTLTNDGTIIGTIYAITASLPNNGIGATITNSNLIQGGTAISFSSGTPGPVSSITNLAGGRIIGTGTTGISILHGSTTITNQAGGLIQGVTSAIAGTDLFTDIIVDNSGTITGGSAAGIWSYGGGVVTNRAGATITGAGGVAFVRSIVNDTNRVLNSGTITATSPTFVAGNGSTAGSGAGIYIGGVYKPSGFLVTNLASGVINGTVYGIYSGAASGPTDAGPVTVENAGRIDGNTGIAFNGAEGTVVNSGTITGSGGVAISFDQSGAYANSLTLGTGSVLNGEVLGGPGADALNLQGTGSETGGRFHNFETLLMQGTDWTLSGDGTFSVGTDIAGGILRIPGTLASPAVSVQAAGTLAGTGTVIGDVTNAGTVAPGDSGIGVLTIRGDYAGQGGVLAIRSVLAADDSPADRLVIDGGSATGSTGVVVTNLGGMGALTTGDGILIIQAVNGATTAAGSFTLNGRVAASAYEYLLFRGGLGAGGDEQNWYLRSMLNCALAPDEEVCGGGGGNGGSGSGTITFYRPEVMVDMTIPALAGRYGLAMLGTWHDRTGGRQAVSGDIPGNLLQQVSWARVFGETGRTGFGGAGFAGRSAAFEKHGPSYDFSFSGIQTGMDVFRRENGDGSQDIAGIYVGAGTADADVKSVVDLGYGPKAGTVSMNAYTAGAYYTHVGAGGWYVDMVAQGTRYADIAATSRASRPQRFKTEGWGFIASAEGGYRVAFGEGWSVEPQAQAIYQHLGFDNGSDQFGRIAFSDSDALYGRIGMRVSKDFALEEDRKITIWTRANLWTSFGASATTTFTSLQGANEVPLQTDLGDVWSQVGLGVSGQVSRNVVLFATGDYNFAVGADRGHGYAGRAGLRIVW